MRWFRGHADAPRLLSLSPLHTEEELEGASLQLHAESRLREMSPVRWTRRKSSSSESERNCYNVQTSRVTTERTSQKKEKKRIREERRRSCEKRNPLLDRVKNTRLSFFRDKDAEENSRREREDAEEEEERVGDDDNENDEAEFHRSRSSKRELTRSEFRRSVCEIDLNGRLAENERIVAKRKRRCKSQSRLPSRLKGNEDRFSFLGLMSGASSGSRPGKAECREETRKAGSPGSSRRKRWSRGSRVRLEEEVGEPLEGRDRDEDEVASIEEPEAPSEPGSDPSRYGSLTASSCLAAKFRAMQDRYLKTSTSKLLAKIYRKDAKDREGRRLRSLSYGTLPGLEELRTNPLYNEQQQQQQEQDDNDSGILDNGSATSSLLDDRCGSVGISNSQTMGSEPLRGSTSPPELPPRASPATVLVSEPSRNRGSTVRRYLAPPRPADSRFSSRGTEDRGSSVDPTRASDRTGLERTVDVRGARAPGEDRRRLRSSGEEPSPKDSRRGLSVVRSRSYATETSVVRLAREDGDRCLGIFIAKTSRSSPGYLVAHVVPNGLADREGSLRIGDEILVVNGKRLRGLSMTEAREILGNGSGPGDVDIVVCRKVGVDDPPRKLKESSVDYENVCVENGRIVDGAIVNDDEDEAVDEEEEDDEPSRTGCSASPRSHFRKHASRHRRERRNNEANGATTRNDDKASLRLAEEAQQRQGLSNFCTLPRGRPRSIVSTFHTVVLEKGRGKKSLGFTIVGGRDSPKGSIGIFIKSVLPGGQAAEDGRLRAGDEILAVNGQVSHDLAHREAVQLFRNIKSGSIALHICRRVKNREPPMPKAKSCADLLLADA